MLLTQAGIWQCGDLYLSWPGKQEASGFKNLNTVRWIIDVDIIKKTNNNHVININMSNIMFALKIIVTLRNRINFC